MIAFLLRRMGFGVLVLFTLSAFVFVLFFVAPGDPAKLAVSPQVLGARVFPGQAQRRFPIDHSDDCGLVWHGDATLTFGGDKQRLLLQIMFAAYWTGSPVLRVAAVLEEAGYGGQVNSLKKAFGRREDWQAFIKFDDGNCWIEA